MLKIAVEAAIKGGNILREGFGKSFKYATKGKTSEIVSKFDYRSEKAIVSVIKKYYKRSSYILEEGGTFLIKSQDPLWLIDPLDGTTNYVRSIPLFAISLAAAIDNEVVVGVIYHPLTDELFTAIKGEGAYLNEKKVVVSRNRNIKATMIATRFPTNPQEDELTFRFLEILFLKGIRVRDFGTSALEMAYLASGRLDGFWISRPKSWDIAAGKLLIEEAGGVVDFLHATKRTPLDPRNLLAGTPEMYQICNKLLEFMPRNV